MSYVISKKYRWIDPKGKNWILRNWYGYWYCKKCAVSVDSPTIFRMLDNNDIEFEGNEFICFNCKKEILVWLDPVERGFLIKLEDTYSDNLSPYNDQ